MFWLILSALASVPLIYWYLTRNLDYWSKRGVPGPKPWPVVGNLLQQFIVPQSVQEVNWVNKYGKIYGSFMASTPVLNVSDPELIKNIIVKDFHIFTDRARRNRSHDDIMSKNLVDLKGDDWKRVRSIISPSFSSGKMKRMYPLIRQSLKDFLEHLDGMAEKRENVNVKDIYGNYTMDVISTCAFATKTNIHEELDNPFVVNARKIFNIDLFRIALQVITPTFLAPYMTKLRRSNDTKGAIDFFIGTTKQILQNRKMSGKKFNDFVQLMLEAEKGSDVIVRDEDDISESHHVNEGADELESEKRALSGNIGNKKLTENEMLAQALIFLLAGFETTATLLTYVTYELALQPHIQQRLCDEANAAFDENGEISYEVLAKLPFLDAVLSEGLRLHSPALKLQRVASTDYKLGDTGITLEKGTTIEIPVYAIHHMEEYFPEPYKFNPDRFMPDNRDNIKPYTYIPFGSGPRNCIGMRFALLEAKLCLAHMMRKYKFFRTDQTSVPLVPKRVFGLNTPKTIIVGIEKRN